MAKLIIWTDSEMELLSRIIVANGRYDGRNFIGALKQAQLFLPDDRQRKNLIGRAEIRPRFFEILRECEIKEGKVKQETPKEPVPAPIAVEAPQQPLGVLETLVEQNKHLVYQLQEIRGEVSALVELIQDLLTSPVSPILPEAIVPTLAEKKRKPKALVVGVNADQRRSIQESYGTSYELSFSDSDANVGSISSEIVQNTDIVIGMTKFMTHATEARLKKHAKTYFRVNGGASSVKTLLESIKIN